MGRIRGLPPRLPAGAADGLGVRPGEKVVGWGVGPEGLADRPAYVIATDRALYADDGHAPGRRIPWHRVSKAAWDEPHLELSLLADDGRAALPLRIVLDEPRDLPAAVRDRVTASVVVSERVDLGDGAAALMAARRDSDNGEIHWSVLFDAGLDPSNPVLRARADEALGQRRDSLGI